jgi:Domain of unknown function (DUF4157)
MTYEKLREAKGNHKRVVTNDVTQGKRTGDWNSPSPTKGRFEPAIQMWSAQESTNNHSQESPIRPALGNSMALPDNLKSGMEHLSGFSLNDVKVHRNSVKPAQLHAHAYAQGTDIHLGPGQEKHLPHEAWHVVQQKQRRVQPTMQMKGKVNVNNDSSLEREADIMGEKALSTTISNGDTQQKNIKKNPNIGGSNAPIQGRFGFEIELPVLFLHKANKDIPSATGGAPIPMNDVPMDAAIGGGETNLHNGPECHVNVDHSRTLNPLFDAELTQYGIEKGLDDNGKNSLHAISGELMPHSASIMEVVTQAWDESALNREQARGKIRRVIDWIKNRYSEIDGNKQAAMGRYYIGSNSPIADHFQPRLGYFHATYGVKLSKVSHVFRKTSAQKSRLKKYAKKNRPQLEHARNVEQTYRSIGAAKTAMSRIKANWPRTGSRLLKKGTKGWNPDSEKRFLGFITLLTNYLLMFQASNAGDLGKQMVGMHYYKSDLYDVAQNLPREIIHQLQGDDDLREELIAVIGASVGLAADAPLRGPMAGYTLEEYLEQILTGAVHGVLGTDSSGADLRDPLLERSINPYSDKLGPDLLGAMGNEEYGVVKENRHLEYLDPNYGRNTDRAEKQMYEDAKMYGRPIGPDTRSEEDKAMYDSIGAREQGPARRPIEEWEDMMMNIYDMVRKANIDR